MRLLAIAAAASLAVAGISATPAAAKPGWHGNHHARHHRRHRVCRTYWHRHHRVRRCWWR